VKKPVLI